MSENIHKRERGYDAFINLEQESSIEGKQPMPEVHISLDDIDISKDVIRTIQSDLQKIAADAVKENEELTEKIRKSSPKSNDGKIHFYLDGLNLHPTVKEKLLERLNHYVKKKGLDKLQETDYKKNTGGQ